MTTEVDKPLELRRTAIQTIAEMDRGLTLIDALLKQARFASARETLDGLKALNQMQELCIREINKDNAALHAAEDVCPFDCDSCHGEDCPCERLGCDGYKD